MMNEELVTEIKMEIACCEQSKRKAEIAIAVANEQRERYAEQLEILHHLLNYAEPKGDD